MGIETSRSAAHRWLERQLDAAHISYHSEHPFPPYAVDVYLPEWHVAVEVDGPQHSAPRDAARDAKLLERYGLPVYRLDTTKSGWRLDILAKLSVFIALHAGTTEERMAQWRTSSQHG